MRLLDANVFITAKNLYYSFDVFPAFWDWLDEQAEAGTLASTDLVFEELAAQQDELAMWAKVREDSIFHVDSTRQAVTNQIPRLGQWMNDIGFRAYVQEEFMDGADPFLIAAALVGGDTVVTAETFEPQRRSKVKIPNACHGLGVPWENTFQMLTALGARFS